MAGENENMTGIAPFVKWVGGKRQLIDEIRRRLPDDFGERLYCEPFIGGGAVLFSLQPQRAVINDFNRELINTYRIVKRYPKALLRLLETYPNDAEFFYQMRAHDRDGGLRLLSPTQRAARFIYLNKTCYNGLYRVNSRGEMNAPFGRYINPKIADSETIHADSTYLRKADVKIYNKDFARVLRVIPDMSFAYLDPPYHPVSEQSFTSYVQGGWRAEEQIRLKAECDLLSGRGVRFMQSNSSCEFIRELYAEYHIETVQAIRAINSDGDGRGAVDEVIITNY